MRVAWIALPVRRKTRSRQIWQENQQVGLTPRGEFNRPEIKLAIKVVSWIIRPEPHDMGLKNLGQMADSAAIFSLKALN
ncbi:MAG: hypothetical protein OXU81_19225 [Gammaproteobacteria bacterium]|nr:hypothetical protein [Gammaproteobacteria bacterium]